MGGSLEMEEGRLSGQLAAMLKPEFHDALDHPIRREVLRALSRSDQPRGVAEIGAELHSFRLSQLSYHLQVLRRAGTVALSPAGRGTDRGRALYASEVDGDGQVKAVLRATEQWDRKQREAAAEANVSPLLTMFRVPRPVRTIRLRSRSRIDAEQER
jgi:DNA-binding transcriptional ArsR family regulator